MKRRDIFTILDDLGSGLEELKDSLQHLGTVFGKETAAAARSARKSLKKAGKRLPKIRRRTRRKVARGVKAGVKQLRVLQGQYMALMRRLSKAQQRQAKKIRKSEGYGAALKFLSNLKAAVK